jgi:pimeloyl-ACP methyl ester carboxylesterase
MIPGAASFEGRYRELGRLPVSILAGAEDMIVDVGRQSARLHGELPGSAIHVLPGLGHMVHYGAPNLVAESIKTVAAPKGADMAFASDPEGGPEKV